MFEDLQPHPNSIHGDAEAPTQLLLSPVRGRQLLDGLPNVWKNLSSWTPQLYINFSLFVWQRKSQALLFTEMTSAKWCGRRHPLPSPSLWLNVIFTVWQEEPSPRQTPHWSSVALEFISKSQPTVWKKIQFCQNTCCIHNFTASGWANFSPLLAITSYFRRDKWQECQRLGLISINKYLQSGQFHVKSTSRLETDYPRAVAAILSLEALI